MRVQGDEMPSQAWLPLRGSCQRRPKTLFGLFRQGLAQPGRDRKAIPAPMDGWQVSQGCRAIPSLPEEIDEVLRDIVTHPQELDKDLGFPDIQIMQVDAGRAPHQWN